MNTRILIPVDLAALVAKGDLASAGGALISLAYGFDFDGDVHGTEPVEPWSRTEEPVERAVAVALMGDEIYERDYAAAIRHYRQPMQGVEMFVASCTGETAIGFRVGGLFIQGDAGSSHRWHVNDLQDPRNDPAYDPWA